MIKSKIKKTNRNKVKKEETRLKSKVFSLGKLYPSPLYLLVSKNMNL